MKESTGGALLMGLAAGIIIIFIIVVAFFISYGKAFRIKNDVINEIEQREGMDKGELADFVANNPNRSQYFGRNISACYSKVEINDGGSPRFAGFTITVIVYMQMDKTILSEPFNIKIPVSGETRIIEKGAYYDSFVNNYGYNLDGLSDCATGYTNILAS